MKIKPIDIASPHFPISLDSLNSFFCKHLEGVYNVDLKEQDSDDSRELISRIFGSLNMPDFQNDWNHYTQDNHHSLQCIQNNQGSVFICGQFKKNAARYSFFISTQIDNTVFQGLPAKKETVHSLLIGMENEVSGEKYFIPLLSLCRAVFDDGSEEIVEPEDQDKLYGTLCYMQQCMATCIAGKQLDLKQNQSWLIMPFIALANTEFNNKVGLPTIDHVLEYYQIQTGSHEADDYDNHPAPKPFLQ